MRRPDHNRMSVTGSYINLATSTERSASCQSQIDKYNFKKLYERYEAQDGTGIASRYQNSRLSPGQIGCWLSHIGVIENHLSHSKHLHVLEDDFVFTDGFQLLLDRLESVESRIGRWDIIFTDVDMAGTRNVAAVKQLIEAVGQLHCNNSINFADARKIYAAGASSYIVHRNKKKKILDILKQGFSEGKVPLDIYLRKRIHAGDIKALVTIPFVTSVADSFSDSTILGKITDTNPSIVLATLFRQSLAWGADTPAILERMKQNLSRQKPISDRAMIYSHLVAHLVSDGYQSY